MASHLKEEECNYSIWRFSGLGHEVASYMGEMWNVEKAFLEKNVMQGIPCHVDALVDDPSLPSWNSGKKSKTADLYR